jgi:hypothetical protein
MKKIQFVTIVFFLIFLSNVTSSWSINEDNVVSSAEKVVSRWEELLSQDINVLCHHRGNAVWYVEVVHLVPGSMSFDVEKTSSIVTPYRLIVNFIINSKDNLYSPNANGEDKIGFKNKEDAFKHMKENDFRIFPPGISTPEIELEMQSDSHELRCYYAFQKGSWVLKHGNDKFVDNIGKCMFENENFHYFIDLFEIPVK